MRPARPDYAIIASENRAKAFARKIVLEHGAPKALELARQLQQAKPFAKHQPGWLRRAIKILEDMLDKDNKQD